MKHLQAYHGKRGEDEEGAGRVCAVDATIGMPGGPGSEFSVVAERGRAVQEFGPTAVFAYPTAWPQIIEGLQGGRDELNVGTVVVKTKDGRVLLRKTVSPGARPKGIQDPPAELTGLNEKIPDHDVTIEGVAWYDNFVTSDPRKDLTPGFPAFPTIIVVLKGKQGEAKRVAAAFDPSWSHEPGLLKDAYADLRVEFEYLPATPIRPGAIYMARYGDDEPIWAMMRSSGERAHGKLVAGEPLDLGIPLQVIPTRVYSNYHETRRYEFNAHDPDRQCARLNIDGESHWLQLGTSTVIEKDERIFRIRWLPSQRDLKFKLKLHEFHRDFYPGSKEARTFESYLALSGHPKFDKPKNIKIDMNHPLRLDGWRLFQHRFSSSRDVEMTILQVNRDPGLALTYPGCTILLLGLVIVFTQKKHYLKAMGKRLRAQNANAERMFLNALTAVLLAAAATLPGVMLIILTPEGPLLGLGVLLIVIGLGVETWWVNCRLAARWMVEPAKTGADS